MLSTSPPRSAGKKDKEMRGGRRNAADRSGSGPIGIAADRSDHRGFRSGGGFRRRARHKCFPHAVLPPPLPPPPPPPAPRCHRADVLLEAGRLAAEYLVAKGLLPAGSLPPWAADSRWRNGGGESRKTSALSRRRVDDGDGGAGPRKRARRRRHRSGSYNRHGAEWGQENRRGGPWTPDAWADGGRYYTDATDDDDWDEAERWSDRGKGFLDTVDGDDSDRQNGSEEGGSGDGVCGKEPLNGAITDKVFLPSKSEVTGELELERENHNLGDDTGSKTIEDCEGKMETVPEAEMVSTTRADDVRVLDLETQKVEKVKVSVEADRGNVLQLEEDNLGVKLCPDMEDKEVSNHGGISLLHGFLRVRTKRGSLVTNKNSRTDQEVGIEGVRENYDASLKERGSENSAEEVSVLGTLNDLATDQCQSGKGLASEISTPSTSSDSPTKPPQSPRGVVPKISRSQSVQLVESVEHCLTMDVENRKCSMSDLFLGSSFVHRQQETREVPPGFELRRTPTDAGIGEDLANHTEEGIKQTRGWSPSHLSKMDEPFHNSKSNQLNISAKELSPDLKIVDAIGEERADEFLEAVVKSVDKSEEQRQLASSSFKILDLNLMEVPETTDISDDHLLEHVTTSLKTENNTSTNFGLLKRRSLDKTDLHILHSNDGKTVPVIDLEDDSPVEVDVCGASRAKSEPVHPNPENFLNHPENPVGLPNIQDGYGLAISEFLGNDIAGRPAVQGDISNLQAFHHAEGITGNDDSLYTNLGELPINFMKVWDQPPPDYEKFF